MLANKLVSLSITLRQRPDLIGAVAMQLAELADCVRHLEHSTIAPHLMAPGILPISENVVRLDTARRGLRA
jgi:hypothetical protein